MGAKGVKVIVLESGGLRFRAPKDPEKFKEANRTFAEGLRKHAVTGQALPKYGTNVLTNILSEAGGYPTYNFKTGSFADAHKISGETLAEIETRRGGMATHGCHTGCVIQCSGVYMDKDGHYMTKQPEYETVWAHGGNCGISDMDAIARLDYLDDNFGLDTIEMGATIGVAMEAGLAKFGDAEAAINLVLEVGKGTPLGRILGNAVSLQSTVNLPSILNHESTMREWIEDQRGMSVLGPFLQQLKDQMRATIAGDETIGMDPMGFLMDTPLMGLFYFLVSSLPEAPEEMVDGFLAKVYGLP